MRFLFLITIIFITIPGFSNKFIGKWTNDRLMYSADLHEGFILWSGINRHEGGYYCLTEIVNDSTLKITSNNTFSSPSFGKVGYKLRLTNINNTAVIKLIDPNNRIKEIFVSAGNKSINQITLENTIQFELFGNYQTKDKSSQLSFEKEELKVTIDGQTFNYEIGTSLDYLENVIILDGTIQYYYEKDSRSLKLYFANKDGDIWEKKNFYKEYILKGNFSHSFLASKQILTRGKLSYFSKQQLRILRNEIYARQGYIFKSDISEYFLKQEWYKPDLNADVKLSKLESLNVLFINEVEFKKK